MRSTHPLTAETLCMADDTAGLNPDKLNRTQAALTELLTRYLADKSTDIDRVRIDDCFYFIFSPGPFETWREKDWWDQREILKELRSNTIYKDRTVSLLKHSIYNRHFRFQVDTVPDQDDPISQYAGKRERLYVKEGYENVLDAVSKAAYYTDKYSDQYPGLLQILFELGQTEEILIVDNGTGRKFHKPYRRITPWRFCYKFYKLIMNHGAYYIGGMHLGLKVTFGRLYCYGLGAVVSQAFFADIYGSQADKRFRQTILRQGPLRNNAKGLAD